MPWCSKSSENYQAKGFRINRQQLSLSSSMLVIFAAFVVTLLFSGNNTWLVWVYMELHLYEWGCVESSSFPHLYLSCNLGGFYWYHLWGGTACLSVSSSLKMTLLSFALWGLWGIGQLQLKETLTERDPRQVHHSLTQYFWLLPGWKNLRCGMQVKTHWGSDLHIHEKRVFRVRWLNRQRG